MQGSNLTLLKHQTLSVAGCWFSGYRPSWNTLDVSSGPAFPAGFWAAPVAGCVRTKHAPCPPAGQSANALSECSPTQTQTHTSHTVFSRASQWLNVTSWLIHNTSRGSLTKLILILKMYFTPSQKRLKPLHFKNWTVHLINLTIVKGPIFKNQLQQKSVDPSFHSFLNISVYIFDDGFNLP